ncbi:MAG: MFS transporter [Actinomycetales bacterium]
MTVVLALRHLARGAGYRRLLAVRLAGQCGDGVFEVTLASLFFFNPQEEPTPERIAAAFAVLLLPFTVVGPWVGVLLDRWRRRQVLFAGYGLRAFGALGVAAIASSTGWPLYAAVLACVAVDRFLLVGLSAGLPHVVAPDDLVTANALTPTLGTAAYSVGAGIALALRWLDVPDPALLVTSGAVLAVASALALRLAPSELGPDRVVPLVQGWRAVGSGLAQGVRHLVERRRALYALGAVGASRFVYAAMVIASILLCRNTLADPADTKRGLALLSLVAGFSGAGFLAAAVVTPFATARLTPYRWIVVCLAAASVTQALVAVGVWLPGLVVAGFVLGLAAQGIKICVDTILQVEVDDAFRGRVFTVYDMVFNAVFVAAAALAALVLPPGGFSRPVYLALAAAYLLTAFAYARLTSGTPTPTRRTP